MIYNEEKEMQISHHPFLFGIIVLCAMVSAVSAAEVVIESDQLVVKGFDDSIGLGAFSIVLGYDPARTTVTEVTFTEPFTGATNIQPDEKTVRISGFTVESGLTGDIPVARIVYEGEGLFDVYVNTLVNVQGDAVETSNSAYGGEAPVSPGTQQTTVPTAESTGTAQASGGTSAGASQQSTPQATGTVQAGSTDTPAPTQQQPTGSSGIPESIEPTVAQAGSSGTPAQTPAAGSLLPPALAIFGFVFILFALKRNP
nr:hypothetical protein [Methanoculleus marisnigri]